MKPCEYLRLLFAYILPVWNLPQSRLCDYHPADYISMLPANSPLLPRIDFSHDFANTTSVVRFVMQERKQFVVTCKDCHRAVPSGVKEFPFQSIVVTCPSCKEQRRYLPSEVFLGRPNELAAKKQRA